LLVAYDIEVHGPQAEIASSRGMLGVGLVLSASRAEDEAGLQLTVTPGAAVQPAGDNAMAACLPLIAALQAQGDAALSLPLGPDSVLQIRIQRAAAQRFG
jgi:hypothetical protein